MSNALGMSFVLYTCPNVAIVKYEHVRKSGTDTEDGGVHGGVKGAASTYVLCPHLTDGAFQFKRGRGRQERSGERE